MKDKNTIGLAILIVVVTLALGLFLGAKFLGHNEVKTIPAVEPIEQQTKEIKNEVRTELKEIRYIQESENYLQLRATLDSLLNAKADTSLIAKTCHNTVKIQDTIILKQSNVIVKQQKIISNDSTVKGAYLDTIVILKKDIKQEKKNTKKSLWKGRGQGAVVGVVVGYVLGKKF